jgi:hypothetical protein
MSDIIFSGKITIKKYNLKDKKQLSKYKRDKNKDEQIIKLLGIV